MNLTRLLFIAVIAVFTSGCAATHSTTPADPLESFNRAMYKFNDAADKSLAKPVAQGYDAVMPELGKVMVNNFFSNLDDVIVTANDFLQFKITQGISDGARVLVNTTLGVGGIIDVASMRLEKHNEDFGQTLGYWGIKSGPYIVLPILGPSTLRDGVGLYVDSRPSKLRRVSHMRTRNQLYATKAISRRAQLLEQEKLLDEAAIDRYEFIRDAYLLRRESLVHDGNVPREDYDDEEGGMKNEQVPIPHTPSAQQDVIPQAQSTSSTAVQPEVQIDSAAEAQAAPSLSVPPVQPQAAATPANTFKVWVAQQH